MLWIYIIIGIVVVVGLIYWFKSRGKGGGGPEMPSSPQTPPQTPPETPSSAGPTESQGESSSESEERPM